MAFRMDMSRWPEGLEELINPPETGLGVREDPYLEELPVDPWGNDYFYNVEGNRPIIVSFGPDRQEGTQDDISSAPRSGFDEGF